MLIAVEDKGSLDLLSTTESQSSSQNGTDALLVAHRHTTKRTIRCGSPLLWQSAAVAWPKGGTTTTAGDIGLNTVWDGMTGVEPLLPTDIRWNLLSTMQQMKEPMCLRSFMAHRS